MIDDDVAILGVAFSLGLQPSSTGSERTGGNSETTGYSQNPTEAFAHCRQRGKCDRLAKTNKERFETPTRSAGAPSPGFNLMIIHN